MDRAGAGMAWSLRKREVMSQVMAVTTVFGLRTPNMAALAECMPKEWR